MEASTAGILSSPVYLARIFWDVFLLLTTLTWTMGFYGFSRVTPFGVCGGPEKDRNVRVCGGTLRALSPDPSCQQYILRHDGNSPSMDGTQVSIIEQLDKVCFRRLLKTHYRC